MEATVAVLVAVIGITPSVIGLFLKLRKAKQEGHASGLRQGRKESAETIKDLRTRLREEREDNEVERQRCRETEQRSRDIQQAYWEQCQHIDEHLGTISDLRQEVKDLRRRLGGE